MSIEKVAVIGAGVMGAGIAAHVANAGIPVLLLDIVPEGATDRNAIAAGAVKKMLKTDPAPFMSKRAAKLVTPGNIEDHLADIADCDWIVEAVIERLDIKHDLYAKIQAVRKPGSIVTSNTSTLPLSKLVEGMDDAFARDFAITHFFNPPRYMRLLEIVAGAATREDAVADLTDFADRRLGKGVVLCNDTPGFIANRIGTFWIQCALVEAMDRKLPIEEVDAVMGRPMGIPKTGVFGLMDLVGIDLMPHVDKGLGDNLPASDAYQDLRRELPLIQKMIADGYTGRKGKGGFYRLNKEGGKRVKEAIDLTNGVYAPAKKASLSSVSASRKGGFKALMAHDDRGGAYAWAVMSKILAYAAALVPEIADDVPAVDRAMKLGYNWKFGPFELIDQLGAGDFAARLKEEGRAVPDLLEKAAAAGGFYRIEGGKLQFLDVTGTYADLVRPEGVLLLEDIKRAGEPVAKNGSASLWDIGDGVACLEFHTKLNTFDPDMLKMVGKAVALVPNKGFKALVIYNEASNFSAGANLGLALFAANTAMWPLVEEMVEQGQKAFLALKRAGFPVVSAPSGMALGGGCEVLLSSDAVQAHAESYIGLVEVGVGIVPGWGGCKEMLLRLSKDPKRPRGPMPPVSSSFETIGTAKVAKSAFEAKELGFLKASDGITFNRERLLADAKARALALVEDYAAPEAAELTLPGPSGAAALRLALKDLTARGLATPHDQVVAGGLVDVLTGGPGADITEPVSEEEVLKLERETFMKLIKTNGTLARMEHMIETGKPLRN
ncbi:3-hydroxyacyl-CoA dehydrogenase/enoyl-CoA hydratase family protein [Denitrobaculum tricleocarpae]|uniref:3-hydroxyacyl-CoA dehydrogenase n=1 Tax=Denitrobaculum tricleocarpae TaxID=2591009 RepID=A0A545TP77_9PROT|nr:3-hydroxyacyl-CoA dehydrogenase/enoyl-CoA hydratase family protein [Denitrobaculum tricleocarpae]TQV79025.1 3-hydroxyacyl-CoA dehydrogenase [Denitrobaculum tricleocarpae]